MQLVVIIVSRVFLFFGAFVAKNTVPYLGFFPYKELLVQYHLPGWISAFANFDGIHYLLIAKNGYSQWEQAFFPLFPLLIKLTSFIIPNHLISALLISNLSFIVGIIFFMKLLKSWGIKARMPLFFLLSFPTAFFFCAVYTEGLFFMLFILSLYFLHKKKYWIVGLCAALSSATRLVGVFLVIPFFFHFFTEYKGILKSYKFQVSSYKILVLLTPFLGLFSYMSYLWITTGDPLFFFNSQPIFGAHRSTHFILLPQVYYRYIKILLTATHDFQWYLSLFEMCIFSFVFIVLILDLTKIIRSCCLPFLSRNKLLRNDKFCFELIGLNIFSLINLILPTLTGTFSSIPRYALFSLSLFIYLGQLKSRKIQWGIGIVFITLQIALLALFIQGYFVG